MDHSGGWSRHGPRFRCVVPRSAATSLVLVAAALWAAFAPAFLYAQSSGDFVFTTYGMEEGLSQGTVEAILQDEVGFLWIGTHDGVNRFDGMNFRAFRNRRDDPTSLVDDYVLALAEADGGKLWVGTSTGGLNLLDPLTGAARHFGLEELGSSIVNTDVVLPGRAGRTVEAIIVSGDGSLVLRTDVGLAWFDPSTELYGPLQTHGSAQATATCRLADDGVLVGFRDGSLEMFSGSGSGCFAAAGV